MSHPGTGPTQWETLGPLQILLPHSTVPYATGPAIGTVSLSQARKMWKSSIDTLHSPPRALCPDGRCPTHTLFVDVVGTRSVAELSLLELAWLAWPIMLCLLCYAMLELAWLLAQPRLL